MMRLEKRIRALEARMLADPVILYFADGSTREICGRADYLLSLFCDACYGGELSPRQSAELDLIRDSVSAGGASCAQMTHLCEILGRQRFFIHPDIHIVTICESPLERRPHAPNVAFFERQLTYRFEFRRATGPLQRRLCQPEVGPHFR
jgi:hypothetical protein